MLFITIGEIDEIKLHETGEGDLKIVTFGKLPRFNETNEVIMKLVLFTVFEIGF